ncbi:hypothetical protein GA0115253_105597 [Streptomyces sp. Termitarium-T10T-6]|nr:hypothetical protein GA0115253_105597 [Streptomyces sp. Termitarium-T10T-6]
MKAAESARCHVSTPSTPAKVASRPPASCSICRTFSSRTAATAAARSGKCR